MSPIAAYLEELAALLRRGTRRRRILAEVRTHLLDAAAAGCEPGEEAEVAQRRAVARFGSPPEVAGAFNALRRRRRALVRRAAVVAVVGVATASVGTAIPNANAAMPTTSPSRDVARYCMSVSSASLREWVLDRNIGCCLHIAPASAPLSRRNPTRPRATGPSSTPARDQCHAVPAHRRVTCPRRVVPR